MMRSLCKSKIHGACVTEADLHYEGSITIDRTLMKEADLVPYEKVQIANLNNGSRLETYVIEGEANSGQICMNGAAARLTEVGDRILIISYCMLDEREIKDFCPKLVHVDQENHITQVKTVLPNSLTF